MMEVMKTLELMETSDMKKIEKRNFTEIKPVGGTNILDARSYFDNFFQGLHEKEKEYYTSYEDRLKHTPSETSDLGIWEGDRGESKFVPNPDSEVGKAAKEKLSEYGMDGVEYESAEPDFAECCEAQVKIDNMTENRENYIDESGNYQFGNFAQADTKCAEFWNATGRDGKDNWTAADVRDWRRENKCSWHECCDTSTMQLVSRDIHGAFKHSGGVAECKVRDGVNAGGEFDE